MHSSKTHPRANLETNANLTYLNVAACDSDDELKRYSTRLRPGLRAEPIRSAHRCTHQDRRSLDVTEVDTKTDNLYGGELTGIGFTRSAAAVAPPELTNGMSPRLLRRRRARTPSSSARGLHQHRALRGTRRHQPGRTPTG